ncbi:MAG: hypothetical protein JWQ87_3425 [Candidatus Sulfotelmatobacter sp.]|nr:hypothetical protein [Candidatus Sulfotelmatobacter sp.]
MVSMFNSATCQPATLRIALLSISCMLIGCGRKVPPVRPVIQTDRAPAPLLLAYSPAGGRSVAVRLLESAPSGVVTLQFRNNLSQSVSSSAINTADPKSAALPLVLPTPWSGDLQMIFVAHGKVPAQSKFVGIVIKPVSGIAGTPAPNSLRAFGTVQRALTWH